MSGSIAGYGRVRYQYLTKRRPAKIRSAKCTEDTSGTLYKIKWMYSNKGNVHNRVGWAII